MTLSSEGNLWRGHRHRKRHAASRTSTSRESVSDSAAWPSWPGCWGSSRPSSGSGSSPGTPSGRPTSRRSTRCYLISGGFFAALIVMMLAQPWSPAARRTSSSAPSRSTSRSTTSWASTPSRRTSSARSTCSSRTSTFRRRDGRHAAARAALRGSARHRQDATWPRRWPREAGVPFLFVSATSFQSMYYGATARKIRSYFSALRKAARARGRRDRLHRGDRRASPSPAAACDRPRHCLSRAHGRWLRRPHRPADASAPSRRRGLADRASTRRRQRGCRRRRQRAARADAVLRRADRLAEGASARSSTRSTRCCPPHRQLQRPAPSSRPNILLIAATNRADNLDPALLRPGRFDRRLTSTLPGQAGRRELIDHFLARKSHAAELDDDERRDALAGVTQGYSPVDDRAPARRGTGQRGTPRRPAMTWNDVEHARLVEEVGLGQPVGYTDERGAAHRDARGRARDRGVPGRAAPPARGPHDRQARDALGLLAHGDPRTSTPGRAREMPASIQIAMGGQVRRGAVLRRHLDRPRRRPAVRHERRGADGRRRRHDGLPDLLRGGAGRRVLRTRTSSAGCSATRRRGGSRSCCRSRRTSSRRCSRPTGTWSRPCATRCSSGTSWSGAEITDVLERSPGRGRGGFDLPG